MTLAPATPETAALTCQRRRNTYLPGTIHKRLQITDALMFVKAFFLVLWEVGES